MEIARRPGGFALVGTFVAAGPGGVRIAAFGVADRPARLTDAEVAAPAGAMWRDVANVVRKMLEPRDDVHATGAYPGT
jgi:CO/xanthine dehydrogenase FAD-binding subunit